MANADNAISNAVKLAGEVIVPGGSNLIKGDIRQGAIHAVLGLVAGAWFGLPGLLLVKANSYAQAVTGRGLTENLAGEQAADTDEA
jgi:hypothetical protein